MSRVKILLIVLATLAVLVAFTCFAAAVLPYGTLKPLADSLMSDGNFKSLKEGNALIFRCLLGAGGVLLGFLAAVLGFDRLRQAVKSWGGRFCADFTRFMKALKPARSERLPLGLMAAVLCLAAVIRIAALMDPMSHDEAYTFVVFGSGSLFNTVTNYELPNNHVLNSILIFFSTHVFGIHPWAVRLPALIAGLLLIPAVYALARAIYDPYTGLAGALLVAILPGSILYSTTARGYSLVALFTLLTLWLAIYLRREKNLFAWLLLAIFSALGFYSVPVMLFPFGMVFTWFFLENLISDPGPYPSKRIFLAYWFAAGLGTAILVLLLYTPIFIYSGVDKVFANHWVTPESWDGYLGSIPPHLLSAWQEWTRGLPTFWSALFLAGVASSLIFHSRIARGKFPLQIAAFVWLSALVLIQRPIGVQKIWAFLQAPFMIWAAAGFTGPLKDVRVKIARNFSAAAVVVGLIGVVVLAKAIQITPTLSKRWADRGPEENTVLFLRDQLGSGDLIIIDSPYDAPVWYYSRQYGIADNRFDQRRPFDHLFVIVSRGDDQTVASVLRDRGPDPGQVNLASAKLIMNYQQLDTYLVPHQ